MARARATRVLVMTLSSRWPRCPHRSRAAARPGWALCAAGPGGRRSGRSPRRADDRAQPAATGDGDLALTQWFPDHFPDLVELEGHLRERVTPPGDYGDFLRWVGELKSALGPDAGRLQVVTDALDSSVGVWAVRLFGTEQDRLHSFGR